MSKTFKRPDIRRLLASVSKQGRYGIFLKGHDPEWFTKNCSYPGDDVTIGLLPVRDGIVGWIGCDLDTHKTDGTEPMLESVCDIEDLQRCMSTLVGMHPSLSHCLVAEKSRHGIHVFVPVQNVDLPLAVQTAKCLKDVLGKLTGLRPCLHYPFAVTTSSPEAGAGNQFVLKNTQEYIFAPECISPLSATELHEQFDEILSGLPEEETREYGPVQHEGALARAPRCLQELPRFVQLFKQEFSEGLNYVLYMAYVHYLGEYYSYVSDPEARLDRITSALSFLFPLGRTYTYEETRRSVAGLLKRELPIKSCRTIQEDKLVPPSVCEFCKNTPSAEKCRMAQIRIENAINGRF